jgi:hypothetical protein
MQFGGGKVIFVALVVSGCDGAKMLEFIVEALDEIALAVEPLVEGCDSIEHEFDIACTRV